MSVIYVLLDSTFFFFIQNNNLLFNHGTVLVSLLYKFNPYSIHGFT